ncbi:MAG: glycosyltransferase family 1 protein [Armatimonas sp.]
MRVVLDARPLSHPQAGGFRSYVRGLVAGLAQLSDVEVILYLDRPVPEGTLPGNFATRVLSPDRLKTDLLLFAQQVRADAPDLVHGTVNYVPVTPGFPQTLTLHDALGMKTYPWEKHVRRIPREKAMLLYWRGLTKASAKRARRLVTPSQAVANELATLLGRPAGDFRTVYNSVQLPMPSPDTVRAKRTVLAIASPDPRKNLACLYDALSQHPKAFCADGPPQLNVVCTNADAAVRAEAELTRRALTNYQLLTKLDDQKLANALASATVFSFPSLREGFGLPPVEAMLLGTPVVSSDADPMPEILGDAAVYFPPDSPEKLALALAQVLNSPAEQASRSVRGLERAARYTPLAQAQGTVAAWEGVVR